jgi:uncharacterized protein (TIGR02246 family)
MTNDERAIRELLATWFDTTKRGDTATVLNLMTDDVVFMVPGREPFGREAFQNTSNEMKAVRIDGTSDIRELRVLGDWAYMRTHITVTTRPPSSAAVTRSGYTLTILRKEPDGRWLVARDANLLTVASINGRRRLSRMASVYSLFQPLHLVAYGPAAIWGAGSQ